MSPRASPASVSSPASALPTHWGPPGRAHVSHFRTSAESRSPCASLRAKPREAIASLKIAGLNLPAENLATLERLGLRKIGDLYPLADVAGGRAALARRFGPLIARHLMQALGAEAEPLAPDAPPAALRTRLSFAEPISAPADIERAVAWLAGELCAQLEAAALGARRLSLVFHRVDGEATRIALGTSRPSRDAAAFRRLFAGPIQQIDLGFRP